MLLDHHQSPVKTRSSVIQSAGGTTTEATRQGARATTVALRQPSTALITARPHASGRRVPATASSAAHAGVPIPAAAAPTTSAA